MKWLKRAAIVLGVLIVVGAVAPMFVSLEDYIPDIEKAVSERIGQPVSIDHLRAAILPYPHLTLDGVTIGDADQIKAAKVTVTPELWTLLDDTKVIRQVEVDRLDVAHEALGGILALTKTSTRPSSMRVADIHLKEVAVRFQHSTFGPFDARVQSRTDRAADLSLSTRDGALKARIQPDGDRYALNVTAKEWQLPAGPSIHFTQLNVAGVVTSREIVLQQIDAQLYGGKAKGNASIGWGDALHVKGTVALAQVELKPLARAFSVKTELTGQLTAKPVFTATASSGDELPKTLHLETRFDVRDGAIRGLDIAKAASGLLNQNAGGETRFDHFSGRVVLDRGAYRFSDLNIASGTLSATGAITLSTAKALSGRISARLGVGTPLAAVPLELSGTVDHPMLMLSRTSIAGAALGTAVLGPGVGTTLGAKLGELAGGVLGSDSR